MLGPKSSHLVERAAEHLLKQGLLEGSPAQLLEPGRRPLQPPTPPPGTPPEANPPVPTAWQPLPPLPIQPEPAAAPLAPPPIAPAPIPPAQLTPASDAPAPPPMPAAVPITEPAPADPAKFVDIAALERAGLFDWSRGRSRISEEFRLAQRQILRAAFADTAEPGISNLVMVTSARPGEGKSFTSLNLACSIALQGDHHVLLVDADSKRDSLCQALGLADAPGILDMAADPTLDPAQVILRTAIERLSILPIGQERNRSMELFAGREMTRLIQSLGRRFSDRLLILDAPPCLSTSDPATLAPAVGQILFVVEAERTQRDEVEASLDLLQTCPGIMLLLNKMQISSRYTFGAYSNYYSS